MPWLCTASGHIHPVLQPWRGSSPALLVALVVTAALHGCVLSLFPVLCDVPAPQAVLVLLSALRNEGYEMCSAGSGWRRQLISQADREICKLKMAYRSLFTAHRMKPRPRHPYICAQRLSK